MFTKNTAKSQEFLKELAILQNEWAEVLLRNFNIDYQLLEARVQSWEPILDETSLNLNTPKNFIINIIQDTVGLVETYQPKFKNDLAQLKDKNEELYEIIINGDEATLVSWSKVNKVSPQLAGQLIDWILRPKRMALGQLIQPILKGDGERNCCPVCGEEADLAFLQKENGERHLGCSGCQVNWKYPRMKCSSCGNTAPETLKYFFVEEAPEQQVHYCQVCNNYLKTFDYRFTKENFKDFFILNLMTLHLDVLAEEKCLGIKN